MHERSQARAPLYKTYLLVLLTAILVSNYMDRLALGVMLQGIKTDLGLSDTDLGVLSGIAFALFYAILGVPIARWADRGDRVIIISASVFLWSLGVALCGTVTGFYQLLAIRVGIAVGEAGCVPPAFSLISDNFTRSERPRAIAIYGMGGSISALLSYLFTGWTNQFYGWRLTFVLIGLPGLALSAVALATLREPRRGISKNVEGGGAVGADRRAHLTDPASSMGEVGVALWRNKTFRNLLLCLSAMMFFVNGVGQWVPTFFIRSFGLRTGEVGTWLGVFFGVGGMIGSYLGGELASRYAAGNEGLQLRAVAWAIVGAGLLTVVAYLSRSRYIAFPLMGVAMVGLMAGNGPLFSAVQTVVPPGMRAVSLALVLLCSNLLGLGLGPLITGALSDQLQAFMGEGSALRYALIMLTPGYFLVAWLAWRASGTISDDLVLASGWINSVAASDSLADRSHPHTASGKM